MSTPSPDQHFSPSPSDFLTVGIGASAGGIEALQAFFEQVPADGGVAYVVILHLSPDHDSQLAQVLQQVLKMPVQQVTAKTRLEPDHVYVISPDRRLLMEDGHLLPSPYLQPEERRAPVDIFFRTLAEARRARAVGVILSGTGANGSMGLKRIKEQGGAVYVQNPREAAFNEMPRNAIATGMVDEVLNVAEIPAHILAYGSTLAETHIAEEPEARNEDQQQALREIFTQLRLRTGHDFSNYKRATLMRRIERRMAIRSLTSLPPYAVYANDHPEETQALLKDLLISVTNFFRDKTPFDYLEKEVLPQLFKNRSAEDQVRIWVAGCATGEEAYTLAMLCAERTLGAVDAPKVQIFATDIDEAAIATAREGLYTLNDAADVSPERLARFFTKEGDSYRVRREIRETILFAHHNFLKDPPFSRIDLISCRNVLIYLNRQAQERVMETFHFALRPDGFLLLGTSESVDTASDLFRPFSREQHLYQSRLSLNQRPIIVPDSVQPLRLMAPAAQSIAPLPPVARMPYGELHLQLLEQYAPPSLLVNAEFEVVHTSPHAGRYLQLSGGEPTQAVLKLVREELRSELRNGLYQASQKDVPVNSLPLRVRTGEGTENIRIRVQPVPESGGEKRGFLLVVFEPAQDSQQPEAVASTSDETAAQHLEDELLRLRLQLRASNEQHEFQAEELKAGNEELQAMNEELRSATEELETSKEELQSINEELSTVNQELKVKVEEATMISNNLQNLINSTDIGTIFLDRSYRVVLFTPAIRSVFNLIPADYGRPLSDITSRLEQDTLLDDAHQVLERLLPLERELRTTDGRAFLARLSPYRTEEDRIRGVVISMVDITERKLAEEALRRSEEHHAYLLRLTDALRFRTAPADIEEAVTLTALQHFGADRCYYCEIADGQAIIHRDASRGNLPSLSGIHHLADFSILTKAIEEGKPFVVNDVLTTDKVDEDMRELCVRLQLISFLNVPVIKNGKAVGELCIVQSRPRDWAEVDIDLAAETAERAWTAIDRARTELALRESENRFRAITTAYSDVLYSMSPDWAEMRSLTSETFLPETSEPSLTWLESYIPPEDQPFVRAAIDKAIRTKSLFDLEHRVRRADGTIGWTHSRAVPILDEAGEVVNWFGTAHDTTSRRQTEDALRMSEERYRITLQSANMAAWDWNVVDDIIRWNDQHFLLLGLPPSNEAIDSAFFLQFIHPDDVASVKAELTSAVTETGVYRMDSFRIIRADTGQVCWMSGYGRAVSWDGKKVSRMVGVMYDITNRIRTIQALDEKQLKLDIAQRAARIGIWGYDLVKDHGIATPEWNDLTGYPEPGETFEMETFLGLVHPDDRDRVQADHDNAVQEQSGEDIEFRLMHPARGLLWMLKRAQYVPSYGGANASLMGSLIDITERKALEELKDHFIGIASHELRTPVTSIKAYTEILEEIFGESGDEQSRTMMQKMGAQVDRLTALIYDLLDTTRITEGKLHLEQTGFSPDELIAEAAETMQHVSARHRIELEPEAGVMIHADRERIRQVLVNLISNALKYSPDADRIIVRSEVAQGRLRICVQDFGIGISEEAQQLVFDRFFRESKASAISGLGLGLFISASIIRQHGGTIWVESRPGEGSRFCFTLPLTTD